MLVFHDDKQLVGFGFDEELVAFFTQGTNYAVSHIDGVTGYSDVQIVSEQGIELQTKQTAFCQ